MPYENGYISFPNAASGEHEKHFFIVLPFVPHEYTAHSGIRNHTGLAIVL